MIYLEHFPGGRLSHFVEKIWYCKADALQATVLTIPLLNHELVFNFSERYKIRKLQNAGFEISDPITWINGLQSSPYISYSNGRHEMIGVLFKVYGLKAFIKDHSSEFTDNFIDTDLVFGNETGNIIGRLQDTISVQDKITCIENFLLAKLAETNYPGYLRVAISKVASMVPGKGSISKLSDDISISNKSLILAFKRYVGINPLKYSHLLSINNALLSLSRDPTQSFTDLAYTLNYYDQSHFISHFKSLTSFTPSEYSKLVIKSKVELGSPNFVEIQG